jgi:acid phosphatase (class A)
MPNPFPFPGRWLAPLGLLVLGLSPVRAAGPYLADFDGLALLPPPPALHGAEDTADRNEAFAIYSARTPEEMATVRAEHKVTLAAFAAAIGPVYEEGKFPKLEKLIAEVYAEIGQVTDRDKDYWKRPRPNVEDPARFSHPGEPEKTPGYPSAHSTRGTAFALILAEVFPERRDAILQKGREIGWVRVEAGVHTPLDIYAGRVLGQAMARAFLHNTAFLQDLAAVNAEVSAAERESP